MKKTLSIILTTAIIFLIITPIKPSAISLQCNDSDVNIHLEKFQEIYSTDSTQLTAYVLKSVENNELDRHVALNALLAIFQQNEHDYAIIEALSWLVATDEMQSSLTEDELDILRDIMSPPSYNKTYITGDIEIRYTYSSDTVPQFVISLATAIYQAETSLISGLSLNRPRSNVITNRFHFYIINATSPGVSNQGEAYTIPEYTLGFRTSYSVFPNVSSSQMVSNLITYQKGSAVHEYTHAITHDYINIGTVGLWFAEGWANWAAVRVYGITTTNNSDVNNYLGNPNVSIKSDDYIYGKFLLPLYINQVYGDSYVADCIKKLSNSGDSITAINNALPGTNTLSSVFANYMRYNYAPKHFYTINSSGWNDKPTISATYGSTTSSFTISNIVLDPLSAVYYEFILPSGGVYRYNITVNAGNTSIVGKLMLTDDTGYISNDNIGTGTYLTHTVNIAGSVYDRGCIMLVNNDTYNATQTITVTVTRTKIN